MWVDSIVNPLYQFKTKRRNGSSSSSSGEVDVWLSVFSFLCFFLAHIQSNCFFCRCNASLLEEGRIMRNLQHDRVVKLLGVILEDGNYSLVMEYVHRGNMMKVLQKVSSELLHPLLLFSDDDWEGQDVTAICRGCSPFSFWFFSVLKDQQHPACSRDGRL